MKKHIILPVAIATIGLTSLSAFAASTTPTTSPSPTPSTIEGTTSSERGIQQQAFQRWKHNIIDENLTDAEKTAFQTMTQEEKRTFIEGKLSEMRETRQAQEAVIDKLLAGETLTAEEETIRQEIITDRAERAAEQTEREAERTEIQTLLDKQAAGTTLTTEEQAKLETSRSRGPGMRGMPPPSDA